MPSIPRNYLMSQIRLQSRLSEAIVEGQTSIATGRRLTAPSQAPLDWSEISSLSREQSQIAGWKDNIGAAKARSNEAERLLSTVADRVSRARELMIQANSTNATSVNRTEIGAELQSIRDEVAARLNELDADGQRIFSTSAPIRIPIGRDETIAASGDFASVATNVATSSGPRAIDDILADAVSAVTVGTPTSAAALGDLVSTINHMATVQAEQGVRARRIEEADTALNEQQLTTTERKSRLADTDVAEAITLIQQRLTTLEAARSTFVRISERTLFDLLR